MEEQSSYSAQERICLCLGYHIIPSWTSHRPMLIVGIIVGSFRFLIEKDST